MRVVACIIFYLFLITFGVAYEYFINQNGTWHELGVMAGDVILKEMMR